MGEEKDYRLKLMTAVVREAPKQGGLTEESTQQVIDYLNELIQARKADDLLRRAMPYLMSDCKACDKHPKKSCPGRDNCEVGLIIKESRSILKEKP